jgi:hypothetical protein
MCDPRQKYAFLGQQNKNPFQTGTNRGPESQNVPDCTYV